MNDVLTAFELSQAMVNKSHEIDQAVAEYKRQSKDYATAKHASELGQAQAQGMLPKGGTVDQRKAIVVVQCERLIAHEYMTDALKNGADKALRAYTAQLSALQSLATALRAELQMARMDNYSGVP